MSGQRWLAKPSLDLMTKILNRVDDPALHERFWAKVDKRTIDGEDECWIWTAALSSEGYGNFSLTLDGREHTVRAHRVAWFLTTREPLNPDDFLDHVFPVCKGRYCVNPMHLDPVTCAENNARTTGTTAASTQRLRRYEHLTLRDQRDLLEGAAA